jgi:hypothetical protein
LARARTGAMGIMQTNFCWSAAGAIAAGCLVAIRLVDNRSDCGSL